MPLPMVKDEKKALLLDYMDRQENVVYFTTGRLRFCDAYNVFSPPPEAFCGNVFSLRAHFLLGAAEKLAAYGITDPIPDMLRLEYIYTTYQRVWWEYLCHYYLPTVTASIVDEYQDTSFIRYVSPIPMERAERRGKGFPVTSDMDILYDEALGGKRISIQGELSGTLREAEPFTCCYLNIVEADTETVYTYALALKKGSYYGTAFWMDGTWSEKEVSAYLIGSVNGERYVYLADLTGELKHAAEVYSAGKE